MTSEELVTKLQEDLNISRVELILRLTDTLADALLATPAGVLKDTLKDQGLRLKFRRLRSVLDTLEKLGLLKYRN